MHHAIPRTTVDLDVLVYPSVENARRVVGALRKFGFGSLGLTGEDFTKAGQVVQLGYEPNRIDILTAISGVSNDEIWSSRVAATLEGIPVWYLGKEQLIKNKKAVARMKDLADLEILTKSTG
jgi:hypothetical protein